MNVHEEPPRMIRACRRMPVDTTPIFLMRQAGRYMPEYRAIRAKHSMLEIIDIPELACAVTLQPIDAFDLDAAIIFADILPPLIGMGLELEFLQGEGPSVGNPIRTPRDVDLLAVPPAEETMGATLEAIRLVAAELSTRRKPLIGFAGAPFTLASYAIEGGGTKNYARTKAFMYSEPAAWKRLMERLVTVQSDYLIKQAGAGASMLQVFDSWAGLALSQYDYQRYVQPHNARLFESIADTKVPVINFSTGTFAYLEEVAACGGDVIGVDWRMPLVAARNKIGTDRAFMGNLDPVALLAPWRELEPRIDMVLEQAGDGIGHIFNLGHGILPETPVENVRRLVDHVHEAAAQR